MNKFYIVLAVLACWRVTRLFTDDFILEPVRKWLDIHAPWPGYLMACTYCMGTYVAAAGAYLLYKHAGLTEAEAWLAWPALGTTTVWLQSLDEWLTMITSPRPKV